MTGNGIEEPVEQGDCSNAAGRVFLLWLLSAIASGIMAATGFYLSGEDGGLLMACASLVLLEIAQSIVLHRYAPQRANWYEWLLLGVAGLHIAIPFMLFVDFFAQAGGGLNPETDVRGCILLGGGSAGFVFGLIQNGNSRHSLVWAFIYTAAVIVAALAGGFVGFWVYHAAKGTIDYAVSDGPARAAGIAAGFLLGMVVYGAVTGLAVAYSVRSGTVASKGYSRVA